MSLRHYARRGRELPPEEVIRRAAARVRAGLRARSIRRADERRPTYLRASPGELSHILPPPDPATLAAAADALLSVTRRSLAHEADLLGSGWVPLGLGIPREGLAGHRFEPEPPPVTDGRGRWLAGRVNSANLAEAQRVWALIDPDHHPIDWTVDLRSGYRWPATTWYLDVRYGDVLGADVKSPWELARGQHLPQLALAAALGAADTRFERFDRYAAEFRNQVLDFIATNPPRFGVNWRVAMDVGIRVANWLVAHDLFVAQGHRFDVSFEEVLERSVLEHLEFLLANLEWDPDLRSNHYLADVAGLVFASAYLPSSPRTDAILGFAIDQLVLETELQFGEDGANFEASTSYHRLSTEMVAYATALVLALPGERCDAVEGSDPTIIRTVVPYMAAPRWTPTPFSDRHASLLQGMADFTSWVTKPDGMVVQVGDNDSGRFFRLVPTLRDGLEVSLDHSHLLGALDGLVAGVNVPPDVPGYEGELLRLLSRDALRRTARRRAAPPVALGNEQPTVIPTATFVFRPGGDDLATGVRVAAFPNFGLYVWCGPRLFLAVRCGQVGQRGHGGHAHNDQLAIELTIDGQDWIKDPGTHVYTPLPLERNRYRSALAHFVPWRGDLEPAPLDRGLFTLPDATRATCLHLSSHRFVGEHHGFGGRTVRSVWIESDVVRVDDAVPLAPERHVEVRSAADVRSLLPDPVPFSPGYGQIED